MLSSAVISYRKQLFMHVPLTDYVHRQPLSDCCIAFPSSLPDTLGARQCKAFTCHRRYRAPNVRFHEAFGGAFKGTDRSILLPMRDRISTGHGLFQSTTRTTCLVSAERIMHTPPKKTRRNKLLTRCMRIVTISITLLCDSCRLWTKTKRSRKT